jgi:hypothetical protein
MLLRVPPVMLLLPSLLLLLLSAAAAGGVAGTTSCHQLPHNKQHPSKAHINTAA